MSTASWIFISTILGLTAVNTMALVVILAKLDELRDRR